MHQLLQAMKTTYLFIDARYLHEIYTRFVAEVYADKGAIDFYQVSGGAVKVFYYDCLDDEKKAGETPEQFSERIKRQEQECDHIRSLNGYHVRLGSIIGSKKNRRQKKVDVQLAVDMLTHAFTKNMSHATLLAGDLDFLPVVESLIQFGTYVTVWGHPNHTAKELMYGADSFRSLGFQELYGYSTQDFKKGHPSIAETFKDGQDPGSGVIQRKGMAGDIEVNDFGTKYHILLPKRNKTHILEHVDRQVLERAAAALFPQIKWDKPLV